MSQTENNNHLLSNLEIKNMSVNRNPENRKQMTFSDNPSKYPILIQKGDNNYKYSSKKKASNEEKKEDKIHINPNPISNNKYNLNEINNEEDYDKSINIGTKRNLKESNQINEEDLKEEIDIREKLGNEYEKNEINLNKGQGSNTNVVSELNPSICTIVLRTILYNLIRPIYIYLLIICIILCIPAYSDLPVIVSMLIYLIIICTSIVIEIIEEKKGINNLIFFDENTEYDKITDNEVIKVPGKNIQKSDIIVVKKDSVVPCDMIIIDSSVNSLPLFFQSDSLTGDFNFGVRLIKKNFNEKFNEMKKTFGKKFSEFIKNLESEEIQKMLEDQKKIQKSQLIYKDFLERNNLINEEEEEKKREEERQRKLNELKFDPNNKIYEDLRYQEYFKYLSQNIFQGYFYTPKDEKKLNLYLELQYNEDIDLFEINQKNICFCGEKVKNADWVIGIVINIGQDVKPLKQINKEFTTLSNYLEKRKKVFEIEINSYFYILLTILLFLSIIAGIINMLYVTNIEGIYNRDDKNRHPKSPPKNFYHSMLEYLVLMHSIIPYPIFFTLEIVLLFQKLYINSDIDIINKNHTILTDSKMIQDLGKIDLILTDKTGTLTKNERFFRYCVIADGCYEYKDDNQLEGKRRALKSLPKNYKKPLTFTDYDMINSSSFEKGNGIIDSVQYDGYVVRSVQNFNECIYLDRTEKLIEEFWKAIALCHDAIPVFNKNNLITDYYLDEETKYEKKYFSNNSDNTTLVEMASKQGFTFFMDEKNTGIYMGDGTPTQENNKYFNFKNFNCEIILGSPGPNTQKLSLPIRKLCHLKFHSQRKRESVIVKDGNYIKLYIKGPMEEILPRIIESYTPKKVITNSKSWLSAVQSTGCRTFVVAMRILTEDEYKVFKDCFFEAHLDEVNTKIRINKVIDSLESDLTLLGGAFIEDYLPEKIEEAISNIKDAGIKIWTVTGDKVSNSYNVGIATGIIKKNNEIIIAEVNQEALLEKQNEERNLNKNINKRIKEYMNKDKNMKKETEDEIKKKEMQKKIEQRLETVLKSFNLEFKRMQKDSSLINYANKFDIVIDSLSFREISKSEKNIKNFFDRAILANSLTFCEFNSNDKRLLVKNFRNYIKGIKGIESFTMMGVGDGFNDIEFLKEVDIGVGLNNGINKFTKINLDNFYDISRLIMFHGINNMKRNTEIVELLLVRHFIFGFIFFLYGLHCFFSNINIIPTGDIYISLFVLNLFGPFLKGIFDINVYYFYDKKEKIEKKDIVEINNELDSENQSKESDYEKKKKEKEKDKNNEYLQEIKEKEEKIRNKMFKKIFDSSFKYIYSEKNNFMIESGSEHIPYKKYISINKFILLILKSILFALINFYVTFGSIEAGHNIIDLKGNLIDIKRLQLTLWTNYTFIVFIENEIFTYYYTIFRLVEIIFFVLVYLIIYILYQRNDTKTSNPFNSFLLFLNFLIIVLLCSFVNFWVYIVKNLFDNGIIYKLRYMKILDRYLEEMKEMVDYREETEEELDESEKDEFNYNKNRKTKDKFNELEIVNEESIGNNESGKNKFYGRNYNNNYNNNININNDTFNGNNLKEISSIHYNNQFDYDNTMDMNNNNNNNNKIIINRKKKGYNDTNRNFNEIYNDQRFIEYFNKDLIQKKEIKNSQIQDSINIMRQNQYKKKPKENKNILKYVQEKK